MSKKFIYLTLLLILNLDTKADNISDVQNLISNQIEKLQKTAFYLQGQIFYKETIKNLSFDDFKKALQSNKDSSQINQMAKSISSLGLEITDLKNKLKRIYQKIDDLKNKIL